ncbi:MAG: tryptophan--tRNA ligase [Elusimicrobiaceae bacterium]|nr:tryptophan--tRNA ligase [Elusimicrobiaceae bacterium]
MEQKAKIVSGMRPTGRIHLGNYWGALKNWIALQDKYDCAFFVADWHALTTGHEDTAALRANGRGMVIDWLAAGFDPDKSALYRQSDVPEIAELALLLGMFTPLGWLLRNPTFKEQLVELYRQRYAGQDEKASSGKAMQALGSAAGVESEAELSAMTEFATAGFLAYPVLMTADIIIHKAEFVPVGKDQIAHVEIARDIVRRFDDLYGGQVFPEPRPLLTESARVPGLDGRKMSKSYRNAIEMGEESDSLRGKVMAMFTDPNKKGLKDPANPDGCVVFAFHRLYNPAHAVRETECRAGSLGCVACKKHLFELMEPAIAAFRARRAEVEKDPGRVDAILEAGAVRVRDTVRGTMEQVRRAMRIR